MRGWGVFAEAGDETGGMVFPDGHVELASAGFECELRNSEVGIVVEDSFVGDAGVVPESLGTDDAAWVAVEGAGDDVDNEVLLDDVADEWGGGGGDGDLNSRNA